MPSIQDLYKRFPPIAALKQAISRGGNAMEKLSNLPGNQKVKRFFEPTEQVRTRDFIRELPGAAKTIAKTFYQEPARYTTSLLQRPVLGQDVFTPQTKFEKFFLRDEPIKSAETSYFAQKARERGASEGKAANIGRFAVVGGLLADVSGAGRAKGAAKAFALANDTKMVEKVAAKAKIKLTPELTDFLVKEKNPEKIATTLAEYLTTKGVKAIPKEFEPLAEEARKYPSAEEFVKALLRQEEELLSKPLTRQEAAYLRKDLESPGYKPKIKAGMIPNPALQVYMSQRGGIREFQPESDLRRLGMTAVDFYNQATGAKVGKVLPPSNIQQAKAVPPELEPLAKEASKYKSAEEFVKAVEEKSTFRPISIEKWLKNKGLNPDKIIPTEIDIAEATGGLLSHTARQSSKNRILWEKINKWNALKNAYEKDVVMKVATKTELPEKLLNTIERESIKNNNFLTDFYNQATGAKVGKVLPPSNIQQAKAIPKELEPLAKEATISKGELSQYRSRIADYFFPNKDIISLSEINQAIQKTEQRLAKTTSQVTKSVRAGELSGLKGIREQLLGKVKPKAKPEIPPEFEPLDTNKLKKGNTLYLVKDVELVGGKNYPANTKVKIEGFDSVMGRIFVKFPDGHITSLSPGFFAKGTPQAPLGIKGAKPEVSAFYNQATGAKVGKTGAIPPVGNTQSPQSKTPLTQTRGIDQATPQLLSTPLGKSVGVPSQTSIPQETISGVPTVGKQGGDLIRKGKVKAPYIAVRKTPSGKEVPAVRRDSGVFAPKDVETHNFRSGAIGKTDNLLSFAATLDNIPQDQLGKKGFGPMMRLYDQVSTAEATKTKFANEIKQKIAQVLVKNGLNREGSLIVRELAEGGRPAGATQAHVRAAQEIRGILDDLHKQANAVRTKMGKEPIGYLENYWTRVRESSLWQDVIRNDKNTSISDAFDFIVPNEKANPFAKQRVLELAQQPRAHPLKEMDAYVDAIANDIYLTPQIESIKAHAEVLKGRGMLKEANWLGEYIRNNLVGKPAKALTALDVTGKVPQKIMGKVTQARNIGALSFNITWSLLTQPASIVNTVARAGLKNTLRGTLDWFTNPALQKEIMQTPTMVRKTARGIGTTLGGDVDRTSQALYKGSIDKVNDVLGIFSNALEKHLTGASIAAGLRRADKLGIKGTDRRMFAEYIGQTTQSMYDAVGRPLILNPKETRLLFPFQTFANEMFRYARTLAGKGGGIPLAKRERMGQAISVIVGMYLWNQYTQAMGGRAIGSVGTFIPFAGSEVDKRITEVKDKVTGLIRGEPVQGQASGRAPIAPFEDADKIIRAVITFIETGDWQPLRRELTFWGMGLAGIGGATQLNRTIDGLIAAEKGYSETSTGRVRFPVKGTAEKIKAIIGGPYATKAGKEYIKGGFKTLGDVQSEVFKASGGSNFDKVKADREAKKELDALKSGKQAKTGLFGKKPTTPTVRDGIVELSNGKFAYQVGDEWKTANDRDTAKLEVAKDAFKKSNKNFQEFGDYVLRRNEDGSIKTQRKTAYEIEKGKATLTNLKNKKDVKGWLEAAKEQAQRIIKEMEADYTDEVERLKLENQLRILMNQYEKYSSYGGFTKPKKGRKLSGVRTTVNKPSFAKSKAIRAKVKAPKFASISPSKRAAVAFRSPVRKPSASRRAMGGGRSRIRIMGRARGLV